MTSILREFEKSMELEPIQVNYTEPSILDSVNLSDAASTLSFSNYEISFDNSGVSFDEAVVKKQEPPKPTKKKVELPFSNFYVKGGGDLTKSQIMSLRDYLISVRKYAVAPYNDLVDYCNHAISGHAVAKRDINRLSEKLFNEMKRAFEQGNS